MLAGRGEASAAVAVDGRHSELVPALGSQVGQDHVLGEALQKSDPMLECMKQNVGNLKADVHLNISCNQIHQS